MRDNVLFYKPSGTQSFGYGIDPSRCLTAFQRRHVRFRLHEWAQTRLPSLPEPSLVELRWSDDLQYLYVQTTSGLLAYFDSMWAEHAPIHETKNDRIYTDANPAAHVILRAIGEVSDPQYRRERL